VEVYEGYTNYTLNIANKLPKRKGREPVTCNRTANRVDDERDYSVRSS